jgi:hypothetical protein
MIPRRNKPRGALTGLAGNPFENVNGVDVRDRDAGFDRVEALGLLDDGPTHARLAQQPQPPGPPVPGAPQAPPGMPPAPPSARSTDPWSKANVRRTLLDVSAAFGGARTFGEGMGKAAGAVGGRMDQLRTEATPQVRGGVGPDNSFEEVTDPVTGQKTYRRIPEFQRAVEDERKARMDLRNSPTPEDSLDLRARAMAAIRRLPADQQAAAYQRLMYSPEAFGNIDTNGMPKQWDPQYAELSEGMGLSTNQQYAHERQLAAQRERERRNGVAERQGDDRIGISRSRAAQAPGNRPLSSPKPPSGYILD